MKQTPKEDYAARRDLHAAVSTALEQVVICEYEAARHDGCAAQYRARLQQHYGEYLTALTALSAHQLHHPLCPRETPGTGGPTSAPFGGEGVGDGRAD